MADVTISNLPQGTPLISSIIPLVNSDQTQQTTLNLLSSLPFIPKAWVNFDGTNRTIVGGEARCFIRSSYNVSKVVRIDYVGNPGGLYLVYFANPMQNANYSTFVTTSDLTNVASSTCMTNAAGNVQTTTTFNVNTVRRDNGSGFDPAFVNALVFNSI